MSRCPTCEKNARREAAERRASGEVAPVQATNGRLMHFSDEERKRRSELAKRLHAEGRFGGAVISSLGGQAPRRHRIADAVLDYFRQPDKQDLVIKAVESNLKGKNKPARLAPCARSGRWRRTRTSAWRATAAAPWTPAA
jgi:hypothetical protein